MSITTGQKAIDKILADIEIPSSAHEKATSRYLALGEWFKRKGAICAGYDPHIYPQGSFRLGTVVKPLGADGEYDLDLGCRLRHGITKTSHTQEQLKNLVGAELEAYRIDRQIQEELEAKHRCWRLKYADELNFHMDTVPSIPESQQQVGLIKEALLNRGTNEVLASDVASHTGAITDNRLPSFKSISSDWKISNSEGYAKWFEARMKLATQYLANRAFEAKVAQVDALPTYDWKSPLQQSIQLLKRHRDVMFLKDPDEKPISIIITTLAAMAYQGEGDVYSALTSILAGMAAHISATIPRVPNPVNPKEDFADKWAKERKLENNFRLWLTQAQIDFKKMLQSSDGGLLVEMANSKFSAAISAGAFGIQGGTPSTPAQTFHIKEKPASPWVR